MKTLNLKKTLIGLSLILTTIMFAQSAIADNRGQSINKKQANQKARISQGIRSGQLTRKEAFRLRKQQARINRTERRFKTDGRLTPRERAVVQGKLHRASKNIYAQKHDGQKRINAKPKLRSHKINRKQLKQKKRINQGVRSGTLTGREMLKLKRQQASIRQQKRRFKANGKFTKHERKIIKQRLRKSSKNIYRKKYNAKQR